MVRHTTVSTWNHNQSNAVSRDQLSSILTSRVLVLQFQVDK